MKNYHNSQNGKLLWLSHAALQFFLVKKRIHKPEMLVLSQSLLSNKNGRCSTSFKMNSWAADLSSLSFQPLTVVKDLTVLFPLKSHDTQVKKQPIVCLLFLQMLHTNLLQWEILAFCNREKKIGILNSSKKRTKHKKKISWDLSNFLG